MDMCTIRKPAVRNVRDKLNKVQLKLVLRHDGQVVGAHARRVNDISPKGQLQQQRSGRSVFALEIRLRNFRGGQLQARLNSIEKRALAHPALAGEDRFSVRQTILQLVNPLPRNRAGQKDRIFDCAVHFGDAGDFLGIASAGTHSFSAEAVSEVSLCRFPRRKLYSLFDRYPALQSRLLGIATDELTAAQDQMLLLGRKTASEKLASFLLYLARRLAPRGMASDDAVISGVVPLPMNRGDIADYLGLTVETVSRTLSRLKKSGHIAITDPHHITIVQPEKLQDIAEGF